MRRPKTRRSGSAVNTSAATDGPGRTLYPEPKTERYPTRMATITLTLHTAEGQPLYVTGRTGKSLMQAAVAAGVDGIAADCGGCLTCATCHVVVDAEWAARLPAASADEQAMLDMTATPREATSRLSCQIELTAALDGLRVRLPATQY